MERQFGAAGLDFDREAGTVRFAVREPIDLSFVAFRDAFDMASYTLSAIKVRAAGRIVEHGDGARFEPRRSTQQLPLRGGPAVGYTGWVEGVLTPAGVFEVKG